MRDFYLEVPDENVISAMECLAKEMMETVFEKT